MTLQQTNRTVVAAKVASEAAAAEYKDARQLAEKALVEAYKATGAKSYDVVIPGAGKVAAVTLTQGKTEVAVDEAALLAVVQEHQPTEVEEVADPDALTDPEVLALLREHMPHMVTRRVRQAWRTALLKEAEANDGTVIVKATGEPVRVAKVVQHDPTGVFQIKFEDGGRYLVEQAATTDDLGQLREDAATLAALRAAGVDNWEGYSYALYARDEDAESESA